MCFKRFAASFIFSKDCILGNAAIFAFPVYPAMLYIPVPYISLGIVELRDGKLALRVFGAIYAAPGEQARQLRYGNSVKLLMKDMVDALLQVGDLRLKPFNSGAWRFHAETLLSYRPGLYLTFSREHLTVIRDALFRFYLLCH
jgi:hypothetical protein